MVRGMSIMIGIESLVLLLLSAIVFACLAVLPKLTLRRGTHDLHVVPFDTKLYTIYTPNWPVSELEPVCF